MKMNSTALMLLTVFVAVIICGGCWFAGRSYTPSYLYPAVTAQEGRNQTDDLLSAKLF